AELIADAILSVQMQSYENWELVIVDDASDQNDARLIVNLFEDSRITFIRLDEQVGNGQARNAGLAAARGKVVAYLDDDDQWDPDPLLVLLNEMRERGARAAYGAQAVWEGFDEKSRLGREFRSIRF